MKDKFIWRQAEMTKMFTSLEQRKLSKAKYYINERQRQQLFWQEY